VKSRWSRIQQLYNAALNLETSQREAYLDQACGADAELRREVLSLLSSHDVAGDFLVTPALEVAAKEVAAEEISPAESSLLGRRLSHYQVLSPLGAGGMGEVYLAQDTRLGRRVALKLLPSRFTQDSERLTRFAQEARSASALNHPNIVTIYDIGQVDDVHFIATEFIDGQTLRKLIKNPDVNLHQVLDIAAQIARALGTAHEAGIVHRDVKPENVMLRHDHYVKILDFGLAKLTEASADAEAATGVGASTNPGTVMGTVSYMSPEQARGLDVDARSDIFSLGVVIYELAAGIRPFAGPTVSDVLASILTTEPAPLSRHFPDAPPELNRIVMKTMAKDREQRYQTAADLAVDLKRLAQELDFKSRLTQVPLTARALSSSTCPNCQVENPEAARFCVNCGSALVKHCTNCGADLPAAAKFCLACGHQVGGATVADDARHTRIAAATPPSLASKIRAAAQPAQPAQPAGERRIVTALFADLGVTPLSGEEMDAEDWTALMNRALDRLSPAIYRYEGTIARLLGNSLLAFFGAPVAHEDDPKRAALAALDLLDAARGFSEEVRRENAMEFEVRIGLNTGPVILGSVDTDLKYEYTVLGDTVNLATRLQSTAAPMMALASEETYRFLSESFDLILFGPIETKGRAVPVSAWQLQGPRKDPGRERGLVGLESPMVGRDSELAALLKLSATVRAGLGRVTAIVAEPGLGKTRLIAEWKSASGESIHWIEGHCLSYGAGLAYHLLIDLLRSVLELPSAAGESEMRAALLSRSDELFGSSAIDVYPYLGHLLSLKLEGAALERVSGLDPRALQNQYAFAWRRLLHALASRRAMGLILEDVHWADPSSVDVLVKLLGVASEAPVLFCMVTRPDRDAPGWKLLTTARDTMGPRLTELALNELSEEDSRQLISNLLDVGSLPDDVRTLILKKSEGNPFYVEEVIRMLIDNGAIVRNRDGWAAGQGLATVEIPGNLQGLLLARIDRLPDDAKQVLRLASAIGRQFSVKVLEQVLATTV
jgi:serine/threonine protein kinase/class 3 adenylate cyclase